MLTIANGMIHCPPLNQDGFIIKTSLPHSIIPRNLFHKGVIRKGI